MSTEKGFCNKKGTACPCRNVNEQIAYCEFWDPRDVLADKTCRHWYKVDNIELAEKQHAAAAQVRKTSSRKTAWPGSSTARTPEGVFLVNKTGEILVNESIAKARIDKMAREAAAVERIATALEKIANALGKEGDE